MTYDVHESDDRVAGVVTLYEFTIGPAEADILRYTDGDSTVFHEFHPWNPAAIKRTNMRRSGGLERADLTITVGHDNPVARLFTRYPPSYVLSLRILEGHFDDYDRQFLVIWTGRVLNCSFQNGGTADLTCQPASTSMKRIGLRRHYQKGCPLDLYGPECRAVRTEVACVRFSFEGNTITGEIPFGGLLPAAEAYTTGIAQWVSSLHGRTEIRSILSCVEDDLLFILTLNGPVDDVPESFIIVKGCLHTERTCNVWHSNVVNYGGQLWIPDKNPIGTTSTYL